MTTNLNDRALLVQLNVSQWTARKFDKKATNEVATSNGANADVGRYNKSLLPTSDELTAVHKKTTEIRALYYRNTLPWGMEGTQLLPTKNYMDFMTEMRAAKNEWEDKVKMFLLSYHRLQVKAQGFLAGLYNSDDYPHRDEVASKFAISWVVLPVPSTDFRVALASDELERIRSDVEAQVKRAGAVAMQDAWQRLYKHVEHIAERLADPANVFRDSMLESAVETCGMLTRLNVLDDPDLERMRSEVEGKLTGFHPDALRNDPDLRRDTAAEAKRIMDQMAALMGGV